MLTAHGPEAVEQELLARIATAGSIHCFLDYDGTLAPIAPTPAAAVPLPTTAAVLRQLVAAPGIRVTLVSGRTIADLRRFLDVAGVEYVGVHGAEMQVAAGAVCLAPEVEACRDALPELKRQLEAAVGNMAGILVEDKGVALACHYRQASAADGIKARRAVETLAQGYQRRGVPITVTYGLEVVEVCPAGVNKGKAVRALLASHLPVDVVIYIGDDRTDEDAFQCLPTDAVTILVGTNVEATAARYHLAEPRDVERFLRLVVSHRSAQMPS